ncbi:hypothetical protein [Nocardia asteroides]|uniref:hypothetical protein n=1 Tax=Nocardia asteroides TaxID=1824 RepID=UPI001E3BF59A|nr:hypothetical protein [Nocardia asteroides]UGT53963.1 hypothetical protein LTT85_25370 [Nocardia asteroides]
MTYQPNVSSSNTPHVPDLGNGRTLSHRRSRWLALDLGLSAALWILPLAVIMVTLIFPGTWIIVASAQDCQKYPTTCMEPYDILQELAIGVIIAGVVALVGTGLCVWRRWRHAPVAAIGAAILTWTWIEAFGFAFS